VVENIKMEIIAEILFDIVGEALLQIFGEVLIEFGLGSIMSSFKRQDSVNKPIALLGCFFFGLILGFALTKIFSGRIFPVKGIEGLSLIVSPVIVGYVMMKWGAYRRGKQQYASTLSTFWGGLLFAFGSALIRFLMIH